MNEMIKRQLNHRTIRFFKDRPVSEEQINTLMQVMNRTATSHSMQTASMIRVTDPDLKEKLAKIGKRDYIANVPELWIFIVDVYRNSQIAKEKGYGGDNVRSMNYFVQGFTDACLMAQNVVNAAEAMDLGTVYFGCILNDVKQLINLLGLPKLTMPVVGLGFGEMDDHPDLKPRMPLEMKVYENTYERKENYLSELTEYDEIMTHYYDTRQHNQRSDTFTDQVLRNYSTPNELRAKYFEIAKIQGFDVLGELGEF